jgi:hypothetical protein
MGRVHLLVSSLSSTRLGVSKNVEQYGRRDKSMNFDLGLDFTIA